MDLANLENKLFSTLSVQITEENNPKLIYGQKRRAKLNELSIRLISNFFLCTRLTRGAS